MISYDERAAWSFKTRNFSVYFVARECDYLDLSWDESRSVRRGLEDGTYEAFDAHVFVVGPSGERLADDYLCQCIYRDVAEFISGHRDPDPNNRSCTISSRNVGHYFPDMVREACREARKTYNNNHPVDLRRTDNA